MEGTQVLVYACQSDAVKYIAHALEDKPCEQVAKDLIKNIKEVHADCVVFNWECCGGYGG